jgi:NADH:ubiquinone oxidoreductase subunit 3 (subunit A)
MTYYFVEYFGLGIFLFVSFLLVCALFAVATVLSQKNTTVEKVVSYECGFEPFGDSREIFNIQFYIVAILFMLFDLEIAFIFPWAVYFNFLGLVSLFVMFSFLILLIVGFIFEWREGALDWA